MSVIPRNLSDEHPADPVVKLVPCPRTMSAACPLAVGLFQMRMRLRAVSATKSFSPNHATAFGCRRFAAVMLVAVELVKLGWPMTRSAGWPVARAG